MKKPSLSIIIVSFNTAQLTLQTVISVFDSLEKGKLKKPDVEVIVVDNNSTDDTNSVLRKNHETKIRLIENDSNLGFARANNQGVKLAQGDFVLLLNSDTVVHPGSLSHLVSCLADNPRIGVVAASLRNLDSSYQPQGGALPTLTNVAVWWLWPFPGVFPRVKPYQDPSKIHGEGFHNRGWVGGTALLMKKSVYEAVGGLDEKIFMYAEDVDLCIRASRFGLKVGICSDSVVTHLGSASGSSLRARLGEIKGVIYLFKKHKPAWQLGILRCVILKGAILRLFYFGILKRSKEARSLYLQAVSATFD